MKKTGYCFTGCKTYFLQVDLSRINFYLYMCLLTLLNLIVYGWFFDCKFYIGRVKQIRLFFFQSTILLLLAFTSVAGTPFSLFSATTGSDELILTESCLDNIEDDTLNSLDGSDGGITTDGCIFSPPSLVSYPVSILTGQINNRSLHQPAPFYILYQQLIFYHPVA